MSPLIVLCCIALTAAKNIGFHSGSYSVPSVVVAGPVAVSSQYHTQDALGQYSYGYTAGSSAKTESKTVDGVTRGGYSYVDGHGVVQTANYIADDVHGFRVAATNLPKQVVQDTPEVAAAKVSHAVAYNEAAYAAAVSPDVSEPVVVAAPAVSVVKQVPSKAFSYTTVAASPVLAPVVKSYTVHETVPVSPADVPSKAFSYSTISAAPSASAAPSVSVASAPAAVIYSVAAEKVPVPKIPVVDVKAAATASYSVPAAVVTATSHQYHTQDSLGQYSYGYSGGPSAKVETKTLDGVTRGQYSYVDGNGIVQSASYVADDVNGFRVAATNLPVGPQSSVVHNFVVSPVAVDHQVVADTPEVVAAKAAHFAAHAAVKYRDQYSY